MTRSSARRRARLAITACALWLLGVEVLPALHQAEHAHAAPHRHEAGGMVVIVTYDEPTHRHADGTVHHHDTGRAHVYPRPPERGPATPGALRIDVPGDHVADGLAHHAEALLAAPPPLAWPLPIDPPALPVVDRAVAAVVASVPCTPSARGPPVAA